MSARPFPDPSRSLRQVWRHHRRDGILPGRIGGAVQEHVVFGQHPDLAAIDEHLDRVYWEACDEQ